MAVALLSVAVPALVAGLALLAARLAVAAAVHVTLVAVKDAVAAADAHALGATGPAAVELAVPVERAALSNLALLAIGAAAVHVGLVPVLHPVVAANAGAVETGRPVAVTVAVPLFVTSLARLAGRAEPAAAIQIGFVAVLHPVLAAQTGVLVAVALFSVAIPVLVAGLALLAAVHAVAAAVHVTLVAVEDAVAAADAHALGATGPAAVVLAVPVVCTRATQSARLAVHTAAVHVGLVPVLNSVAAADTGAVETGRPVAVAVAVPLFVTGLARLTGRAPAAAAIQVGLAAVLHPVLTADTGMVVTIGLISVAVPVLVAGLTQLAAVHAVAAAVHVTLVAVEDAVAAADAHALGATGPAAVVLAVPVMGAGATEHARLAVHAAAVHVGLLAVLHPVAAADTDALEAGRPVPVAVAVPLLVAGLARLARFAAAAAIGVALVSVPNAVDTGGISANALLAPVGPAVAILDAGLIGIASPAAAAAVDVALVAVLLVVGAAVRCAEEVLRLPVPALVQVEALPADAVLVVLVAELSLGAGRTGAAAVDVALVAVPGAALAERGHADLLVAEQALVALRKGRVVTPPPAGVARRAGTADRVAPAVDIRLLVVYHPVAAALRNDQADAELSRSIRIVDPGRPARIARRAIGTVRVALARADRALVSVHTKGIGRAILLPPAGLALGTGRAAPAAAIQVGLVRVLKAVGAVFGHRQTHASTVLYRHVRHRAEVAVGTEGILCLGIALGQAAPAARRIARLAVVAEVALDALPEEIAALAGLAHHRAYGGGQIGPVESRIPGASVQGHGAHLARPANRDIGGGIAGLGADLGQTG